MKKLWSFIAVLACAGCAYISPQQDSALYTVTSPTVVVGAVPLVQKTLVVETPVVPLWLDRNRIALRQVDHQQDYIAAAKWSSPLPNMIQETIIATLEKTGKLQVFSQRSGLSADVRLVTEIRDFQVEYGKAGEPAVVKVNFTASIVDAITQKLIATKILTAQEKIDSGSLRAIIAGFDKAFSVTQTALAQWVVMQMPLIPVDEGKKPSKATTR